MIAPELMPLWVWILVGGVVTFYCWVYDTDAYDPYEIKRKKKQNNKQRRQ